MSFFEEGIYGPIGAFPSLREFDVRNQSGGTLAVGDVVALDIKGSQAEVEAAGTVGKYSDPVSASSTGSRFAAVVGNAASSYDLVAGFFAVVTAIPNGGGDGEVIRVATQGVVDVKVSEAVTEGQLLVPNDAANNLELSAADTQQVKIVGVALGTTSGAGTLKAAFSGVWPFGISGLTQSA